MSFPCKECGYIHGGHAATCAEYHKPRHVGTIEQREGAYGIAIGKTMFYLLEGNSGLAEDWREKFNAAGPDDIGKQVFNKWGEISMESAEQRDARNADKGA